MRPRHERGIMRVSIGLAMAAAFGSIVVMAGAILVLVLERGRQNTVELVRERTQLVISQVSERLRLHLDPIVAQAAFLAELADRGDLDPYAEEALFVRLTAALAATPQVAALAIIRPDRVQLRVERHEGLAIPVRVDMQDVPGIEEALTSAAQAQRPSWSRLVWSPNLKQPLVNLRTPIRKGDKFLGVMFTTVTVAELSGVLAEFSGGAGSNAFILQGREYVLAHPALAGRAWIAKPDQPLPRTNQIADPVLAAIWDKTRDDREMAELVGSYAGHVVAVAGKSYAFVYQEVSGYSDQPWLIGRYFPLADIESEVNRLRRAAWVAFAVLILILAAAWLLGGAIGRPVRRLARATAAIRDFALDAAQPLSRSWLSEIDEAATAYNALVNAARWFQTYVPRRLVRRLMAQGETTNALETREMTVMFTDIAGFTRLAELLTATETAAFLNRHFAVVAACVEAEAGTIDKFIGDAVMAFWGAPEHQPDHAARACRAARAIAGTVAAENGLRLAEGLRPVAVRIGIHTGTVIVGNIGAPERMNYTVVGDAVNIAQRLEQLAADFMGTEAVAALASRATVRAAAAGATFTPLGTRHLTGRSAPIEIFRVI